MVQPATKKRKLDELINEIENLNEKDFLHISKIVRIREAKGEADEVEKIIKKDGFYHFSERNFSSELEEELLQAREYNRCHMTLEVKVTGHGYNEQEWRESAHVVGEAFCGADPFINRMFQPQFNELDDEEIASTCGWEDGNGEGKVHLDLIHNEVDVNETPEGFYVKWPYGPMFLHFVDPEDEDEILIFEHNPGYEYAERDVESDHTNLEKLKELYQKHGKIEFREQYSNAIITRWVLHTSMKRGDAADDESTIIDDSIPWKI